MRRALLFVVVALGAGCPRSGDPRPVPDPATTKAETTSAAGSSAAACVANHCRAK